MLPRGFTTAEKNLPLLESNTILTEVIEAVGYWGRKGGSNAGYDIGTGAYPQSWLTSWSAWIHIPSKDCHFSLPFLVVGATVRERVSTLDFKPRLDRP